VAHQIGLIDMIVLSEEFDERVGDCIEHLRSSGSLAIKEVKNLLQNLLEMDHKKYKEFTVEKIATLRVSAEGQEGINAFLEKRKPKWNE
jgi:methylglutaconyl-CoA hydratase